MEEAKLKKKFEELSQMKDIVFFSERYRDNLTINETLLISAVLVLAAEVAEVKEEIIKLRNIHLV